MNLWDFKPLKSIFGYGVNILRLEPGDILIFRVDKASLRDVVTMEHTVDTVRKVLPPDVKALFVSEDWEIAVGRPSTTQDVIDGLNEIKKVLSGA